jgi:hypothetical protein
VSPSITFYGDYAETDDPDSSLELFWAGLLESSMNNDTSDCGGIFCANLQVSYFCINRDVILLIL